MKFCTGIYHVQSMTPSEFGGSFGGIKQTLKIVVGVLILDIWEIRLFAFLPRVR